MPQPSSSRLHETAMPSGCGGMPFRSAREPATHSRPDPRPSIRPIPAPRKTTGPPTGSRYPGQPTRTRPRVEPARASGDRARHQPGRRSSMHTEWPSRHSRGKRPGDGSASPGAATADSSPIHHRTGRRWAPWDRPRRPSSRSGSTDRPSRVRMRTPEDGRLRTKDRLQRCRPSPSARTA